MIEKPMTLDKQKGLRNHITILVGELAQLLAVLTKGSNSRSNEVEGRMQRHGAEVD
jgi:hypothetical protein